MASAFDPEAERQRMATFRKSANLSAVEKGVKVLDTAGRTVTGLGKGIWRGAKFLGGGSNIGGAGVLATGALTASQVPALTKEVRQKQQESLAPWQGRRSLL